jgi:hypothetical protein
VEPAMCKSIKPKPTVHDHLAFRWWTYGALILYTASLLVLCGFVTSQKYSLADGLSTISAAAKPPHLPIALYRSGDLVVAGATTLPSCRQESD